MKDSHQMSNICNPFLTVDMNFFDSSLIISDKTIEAFNTSVLSRFDSASIKKATSLINRLMRTKDVSSYETIKARFEAFPFTTVEIAEFAYDTFYSEFELIAILDNYFNNSPITESAPVDKLLDDLERFLNENEGAAAAGGFCSAIANPFNKLLKIIKKINFLLNFSLADVFSMIKAQIEALKEKLLSMVDSLIKGVLSKIQNISKQLIQFKNELFGKGLQVVTAAKALFNNNNVETLKTNIKSIIDQMVGQFPQPMTIEAGMTILFRMCQMIESLQKAFSAPLKSVEDFFNRAKTLTMNLGNSSASTVAFTNAYGVPIMTYEERNRIVQQRIAELNGSSVGGTFDIPTSPGGFAGGGVTATSQVGLRAAMLQRESGGNYQEPANWAGFVGGYQFGAMALETLGYVKPGASKKGNSVLNDPSAWTGKGGATSLSAFLLNNSLQDNAFDENVAFNKRELTRLGVINASTPPEEVSGYLAAAHLLGAGGVSKGLDGVDGNGTSGREYFEIGKQAYLNENGGNAYASLHPDYVSGDLTEEERSWLIQLNTQTAQSDPNLTFGGGPLGMAKWCWDHWNGRGKPADDCWIADQNIYSETTDAGIELAKNKYQPLIKARRVAIKMGVKIQINSAYRSFYYQKWNVNKGKGKGPGRAGDKSSPHSTGQALDIQWPATDPTQAEMVELLAKEGFTRFGVYPGFLHVDFKEPYSYLGTADGSGGVQRREALRKARAGEFKKDTAAGTIKDRR